jgi:CheY-like chemotaxis protein
VIGMLGLLARTKLDGAQNAYLGAARDSADHLLSLVNDLLDFARIEAGKLELESAPVDLERLVQGVTELLSPRAHEKNVEVAWTVAADVPSVLADDGRLRQILFNLAGNAVKFTEQGGVTIAVSRASATARDGRVRVRFQIDDTGPGVPAEARERVFEEFGHTDPSHAIKYGGAGLGLAVVKRLVAAMDGTVGIDDSPQGGSSFWFEAGFAVVESEPRKAVLRKIAVVVASPSRQVRETAAGQIAACGGGVTLLESLEGFAPVSGEEPAILVDHAFAAESELVSRPQKRRALVLLRPEERELIEKYRAAGWSGYLIKPLRRTSVAARVLAAMSGVAAPSRGAAAAPEDERVAPATVAGIRVLVAEDNPVNALLVTSLLKREGCSVELAGSGEEALEALSRTRYDLVLMDMRMPRIDGLVAARTLRERGDTTPIIALTANAFEEDRKACMEAGMDDFLTKPVDAAALKAALARWTKQDRRDKLAS